MNKKGKRSSAASAFIDPQKNTPNLKIKLRTIVKKIIIENKKAIGVIIENSSGGEERIFADKEVILAAGSFITPKILMLSGIGSEEELSKFSIKCINYLVMIM